MNKSEKSLEYNIEQRVMALNWLANIASNKIGTAHELQEEMRKNLEKLFTDKTLLAKIGLWELEWGPVVIQEGKDVKNKVATNAMFVARQADYDGKKNDHYVVAIAGTNAISRYGWFTEDFKTEQMVLWNNVANDTGTCTPTEGDTDKPRVSAGTCIGLTHLLQMKHKQAKSKVWNPHLFKADKNDEIIEQTLTDFLTDRFGGEQKKYDLLSVTEHSLGGALSATMALRLAESQRQPVGMIKQPWNPTNSVTLTAMPTAGATPGNKAFSEYYGNMIGMKTTRVWNHLDPVPYGHQPDMVRCIANLYYPYIIPDAGIYAFAGVILSRSLLGTTKYPGGGHYTQLVPQTSPLQGQFNAVFQPIPAAVILQFATDSVVKKLLTMMGLKEETIHKIIFAINDVLKVVKWLGETNELIELIRKALIGIPFVGPVIEKILEILVWLVNHLKGFFAFLQQLGYQHVWAYCDLMGLTGMQKIAQSVMKSDASHDDFEILAKHIDEYIGKIWAEIMTKEYLETNGLKLN